MRKHVSLLCVTLTLFCFTRIQTLRAQPSPFITITPPDWYQTGDTFISLDAEVFTAGWDSLYVGGYVSFLCNSGEVDTLPEKPVYDSWSLNQGFDWFVHPLNPAMQYCWRGYVRHGTEYFWSEPAYWGMEPTIPSIITHAPQWYETNDVSTILDASVYTAGWDSLYVGGHLWYQCDTLVVDTIYEYQVWDSHWDYYQEFEWFQTGLVPTMSYCWYGYVRRGEDYFWCPSGSYWAQHASPATSVKYSDADTAVGYVDAGTRIFVSWRDLLVRPVTLVGQEMESFRLHPGETKDVSGYPSGFLVLCDPKTGRILGRCFLSY